MDHHLHPNLAAEVRIEVTPASAGWRYLSFRELALKAGSVHSYHTHDMEVAIVPLSGEGVVRVVGQ